MEREKFRRRRVLTNITIDAIAAVDNPAQEGALVAIIKRAAERPANEERKADVDEGFPRLVSKIMERDECSRVEAFQKAARQEPELVESFRNSGARIVKFAKAEEAARRDEIRKRQRPFEDCVRAIQDRDSCTRVAAMQKARTEHPSEYEALRSGGG